jgi:hypothetical protein
MTELSITRIGINGFRGLRALSLEGLGRINILVGDLLARPPLESTARSR